MLSFNNEGVNSLFQMFEFVCTLINVLKGDFKDLCVIIVHVHSLCAIFLPARKLVFPF